jgi:alkylation response protein AidB-like acyl-CoA dehydrogenase
MDFTLTEDQELLRDTARALLTKECPPSLLRAHIDDRTAAAPLGARLAEYHGLAGGPCADLCLFLGETGYVAAPGPFLATTALFAPVLVQLGDAGTALLDAVHNGATGTLAIAGSDGVWQPNDQTTKRFVLEADAVEHIAVVQPGGEIALARGELRPVETLDFSRRVFDLDVAATESLGTIGDEGARTVLDTAHVGVAAEMVGTTRHIFDMTLEYAKVRHQFDRPIGSFQALQHKLADMALALERATAAVQYAAMTVDAHHPDRTRACHVAKAAAGEAARRAVKDGAQIHGGIGYTWEHDLHLFLRRAIGDEYLLGPTGWHHDRIADLLFA